MATSIGLPWLRRSEYSSNSAARAVKTLRSLKFIFPNESHAPFRVIKNNRERSHKHASDNSRYAFGLIANAGDSE